MLGWSAVIDHVTTWPLVNDGQPQRPCYTLIAWNWKWLNLTFLCANLRDTNIQLLIDDVTTTTTYIYNMGCYKSRMWNSSSTIFILNSWLVEKNSWSMWRCQALYYPLLAIQWTLFECFANYACESHYWSLPTTDCKIHKFLCICPFTGYFSLLGCYSLKLFINK